MKQLTTALAQLSTQIPNTVIAGNVAEWSKAVTVAASLHRSIPAPSVTQWPLRSAEDYYNAALLVRGLALVTPAATSGPPTGWINPDSLAAALQLPEITHSLFRSLVLFGALKVLDPALAAAKAPALIQEARASVGCPGIPDLLRDGPTETECDLQTTELALEFPEFSFVKRAK